MKEVDTFVEVIKIGKSNTFLRQKKLVDLTTLSAGVDRSCGHGSRASTRFHPAVGHDLV